MRSRPVREGVWHQASTRPHSAPRHEKGEWPSHWSVLHPKHKARVLSSHALTSWCFTSRTARSAAQHSALCNTTHVRCSVLKTRWFQVARRCPSFRVVPAVTSRTTRVMSSCASWSSHQDAVFAAVVSRLPKPLREAFVENELVNPGLLANYPRSTLAELGFERDELHGGTDTGTGTYSGYRPISYRFLPSRFSVPSRREVLLTGPTQA